MYIFDPDSNAFDMNGKRVDLYRRMHEIAVEEGWQGIAFHPDGSKRFIITSKGSVWDAGHLEYREGLSYSQAVASDVA
jgi:hypothetical protein